MYGGSEKGEASQSEGNMVSAQGRAPACSVGKRGGTVCGWGPQVVRFGLMLVNSAETTKKPVGQTKLSSSGWVHTGEQHTNSLSISERGGWGRAGGGRYLYCWRGLDLSGLK